jgi:SAM-dependent methyltransferase
VYWNDVGKHIGEERLEQFWLANDDVRAAVNEAVSGSPGSWPLEWFAREFASFLPTGTCAVIGCGTGALERDLLRKGIARRVVAIDIAPTAVAHARRTAESEGLAGAIEYATADATAFLRGNRGRFDAVFFHGALHHLAPVREVLGLAKESLSSGGILYVDEYVGPSMHEWRWWRLVAANLAYYAAAPRRIRRPRLVRAPLNHDDPTEMLDSASILPALRENFRILAERGYGGNIVALVYPNLRHGADRGALRRSVLRMLSLERQLTRIAGHHYAVVVAQRA